MDISKVITFIHGIICVRDNEMKSCSGVTKKHVGMRHRETGGCQTGGMKQNRSKVISLDNKEKCKYPQILE